MSMYIEDGDGVCSAMTEGGGGLAGTTTALDAVDSLFTCSVAMRDLARAEQKGQRFRNECTYPI